MAKTPTTYIYDSHEPGNGTRYRLHIVIGPEGTVDLVAWPDVRWSAGDFGRFAPTAEWLQHSGGLNEGDCEPVAAIVREELASWRAKNSEAAR